MQAAGGVHAPRLSILRNADLYAPEHRGRDSLLIVGESIARVGSVDESAARGLGLRPLGLAAAHGARVHFLTAGGVFDLALCRPLLPAEPDLLGTLDRSDDALVRG